MLSYGRGGHFVRRQRKGVSKVVYDNWCLGIDLNIRCNVRVVSYHGICIRRLDYLALEGAPGVEKE